MLGLFLARESVVGLGKKIIKYLFLILMLFGIALVGPVTAGEAQQGGADEAVIKEKIKEIEQLMRQKNAAKFRSQLEGLQKLESIVDAEEAKAQKARIAAKDALLTKETKEAQKKRIKEVEDKLNALLPASGGSAGPGGENRIEEKIDKEAVYSTCRAALEENTGPCDKIKNPDSRQRCRNIFKITYMVNQVIKNRQLTAGALKMCRELSDKLTDEDCGLISRACLTGDASGIAGLPYFEGINSRSRLSHISGEGKHCLGLVGEDLQACLSCAAYTSAIRSGSPEACAKIKGASLRALCQLYFSKDGSICESILEPSNAGGKRDEKE